jgi:putative transposase
MQMVAAQTGQEYNRRKNRQGAYWEDRYHATAIESGAHLMKCIIYIIPHREKLCLFKISVVAPI